MCDGNRFPELDERKHDRPVTWSYYTDQVKGSDTMTSCVTIYSKPCALEYDESGENGHEKFQVVTLTRAEIAIILAVLDEDIAKFHQFCPDVKYE